MRSDYRFFAVSFVRNNPSMTAVEAVLMGVAGIGRAIPTLPAIAAERVMFARSCLM
jgi:hypothetical protein